MARAKNRGYQQSFSPSYTIRRWRLGIYIRLSKEDLKKGKDDSNSVKNQRDLLNDFYRRNIDEFESITEYVDATDIIGLKQNPTNGRRFSPIFLCIGHFSE